MSVVLDVSVRENTGTGGAREARRNNLVPGVIYGGDEDSIAVAVKYNEVLKAINSGQFIGSMIELKQDGKAQKVFTKDIQFHPVTDAPMHLDFYRVTAKTVIEVEVSVKFIGQEESPGLKEGGTLNVVRYSIEVKCPAGDIPDNIEVDVSKMDIGDTIHISDDRDFTIATVVASRAAVEADSEEEGEEVEAGDVPATEQTDAAEGEG